MTRREMIRRIINALSRTDDRVLHFVFGLLRC